MKFAKGFHGENMVNLILPDCSTEIVWRQCGE